MSQQYGQTSAAESDLRDILRYTLHQWGEKQAERYLNQLKKGCLRLATGKSPAKCLADIHPALYVARCEHHYIFCLRAPDTKPVIVAILHEKMDIIRHITARFEPLSDEE